MILEKIKNWRENRRLLKELSIRKNQIAAQNRLFLEIKLGQWYVDFEGATTGLLPTPREIKRVVDRLIERSKEEGVLDELYRPIKIEA